MNSEFYEFRVDGEAGELAREAFPDMRIEEVPPRLILRGPGIDQSHLHGIMAQFRVLGLSIVSAHPVHEPGLEG
jgi:hypothetical protein